MQTLIPLSNMANSSLATFDEIATFADKHFGKPIMKKLSKRYKGKLFKELKSLAQTYLPESQQDFLNKLMY